MKIDTFHGSDISHLDTWTDVGEVEIAFDLHGPTTSRAVKPSCSPSLHHTRTSPDGIGALVRIDATKEGVPMVWGGRLVLPQYGGSDAEIALPLNGPQEWLDTLGIPEVRRTTGRSVDIVKEALEVLPADPLLTLREDGAQGIVLEDDLSGESLWRLMTRLEERRGEWFSLHARETGFGFDLLWRNPLDSPDRSDVVLVQGRNCQLGQSANRHGASKSELIGIANSFGVGADVVGAIASVPVRVLGMKAALEVEPIVRALRSTNAANGSSPVVPMPSLGGQAALEHLLITTVRRAVSPSIGAQITDIGCDLWPAMVPGNLISVRLKDPFGYMSNAVARIRTATFGLRARSCSISVELWEMNHGAA